MELVFSDLIDVAKAHELMDGYYAVTGIPTGIIDGEGKVWTATGWSYILSETMPALGTPMGMPRTVFCKVFAKTA